jgi:selenide,water dikinase
MEGAMQADWPATRDLVLLGGGHAHALVLRRLAMDPLPGARVTLIDPAPVAAYTGMLPGFVAGHYRREEIMVDLARLCARAGVRRIADRATGLDLAAREVLLASGGRIGFDLLSVDVGAGSAPRDLPGFDAHGLAVKPFGSFATRWEAFVATAAPADRVAVLGGGAGGVEIALAAAHRLGPGRVTLVERGPHPAAALPPRARARLVRALAEAGVDLRCGQAPVAVTADHVALADGTRVAAALVLGVAGVRAPDWLAATGLETGNGYLRVDGHLRCSDPAVFAAGDCAHLTDSPRPKAGVYAVRAAPVLAANLRAALSGAALRRFRPQRDHLKLIALGPRAALAEKAGLVLAAPALWRLKDRIDRRFLDRLNEPAAVPRPMAPPGSAEGLAELLSGAPLCGGCGAKAAPQALAAAVAGLDGPGDDAAVLATGGATQVLTTDSLRTVTGDEALMARIAAVHALGDIWAMGASPQAALVQVTLPRAAPRIEARMLARTTAAAAAEIARHGARLVGGHSAVGAEFAVGFTVTGLMPPGRPPVAKRGARPGDALLLTKPLGTGTVLAAAMTGVATPGLLIGEALETAFAAMLLPTGPAAAVLAPLAQAMTDVTGFGLAGHLLEMLDGSACDADLSLAALPCLPGAEALAAAGVASSLAPANRASAAGRLTAPDSPRSALLFDPQTAGGLLAALPQPQVPAALAALHALGETATVIGHVVPGSGRITAA